jgi:hypothetical protein
MAEDEPRAEAVAKAAASIRSVTFERVGSECQRNRNALVAPAIPGHHFHSFTPHRHLAEPVGPGPNHNSIAWNLPAVTGMHERVLSAGEAAARCDGAHRAGVIGACPGYWLGPPLSMKRNASSTVRVGA